MPDLGKHHSADALDAEIGTLCDLRTPLSEKLFTYVRYNVALSDRKLAELGLQGIRGKDVQPLDGTNHAALTTVGEAAAERFVALDDLDGFLFARATGGVTANARQLAGQ